MDRIRIAKVKAAAKLKLLLLLSVSNESAIKSIQEKKSDLSNDIKKGQNYHFKFEIGQSVKDSDNDKYYIIKDRYIENGEARYTVYPPGKKNTTAYHIWIKESELTNKTTASKKVQVQDMPVNTIFTDEKRFQNRANAFSSESANRIIKAVNNGSFDWSKFDPIIIWFDDKAGKYFVLSGHSRLAAFKELSKTNNEFKNIPVKIFSGSQMQAIDLALNSNTLSTKETETERAMYYNRKRQTCEISRSIGLLGAITECEKLVEVDCRNNEGKNANYILNLSYLNPQGFLIESLNKLGIEKDNDSTNVLRTIANWIGEARRNNKELLNVHETEIAKFLLNGGYGNKKGQFKNKTAFNERLKYSFDKWKQSGADPNKPLNLANTLSKSSFEQEFETRANKAKTDLEQAIAEHQEKHTKYLFAKMEGKITEKRFNELMQPLVQNVDWHKKEYERIKGQKIDVMKASSAQTSLFGTGDFIRKTFLSKNPLAGWKDDKEKFRIELVNDIKNFLFTKWEKPWTPALVFDSNGNVINSYKNVNGRYYHHQSNIIGLKAKCGKSPYFITLSKVNELAGKILDKSKLTTIVSFVPIYKPGKKPNADGKITPDWMKPLFHSVINVDYVEGIKKPAYKETQFKALELNQYIENFIEELKKLKRVPELIYDQSDKCYFVSNPPIYTIDEIHLVQINAFKAISEYYSTLFHEITHSTQSIHRLGERDKKGNKKLAYANEELVAEMGAMIVCTELGLEYNRQNSLTYLKGWLDAANKRSENVDDILLESYSFACDAAEYLLKDIDLEKLVPETMVERAVIESEKTEKEFIELLKHDKVQIINHLIDERVKIFFSGKPDDSIIQKLKDSGFKWAHTAKAWQIANTPENIEIAFKLVQPDKADNQTRLRIAKAKASAKLKLLQLVSLEGVQTHILNINNEYANIPIKDIPKLAEDFYSKNIQRKIVRNFDKNIDIVFTKEGKQKSTRGRHDQGISKPIDSVLATCINYLITLTESAIFSGFSYNLKQNHLKLGGVKWWNFYSKIIIDGKMYVISIPVLEVKKGKNEYKFQYAIDYSNIKKVLAGKRTL